MKPIDNMQKKLIHIALHDLRIDNTTYRSMLRQWFDVESCKDLTYQQASTLLDELKKKGFTIKSTKPARAPRARRKPTAPNITDLVTREQLAEITRLAADIRWHTADGVTRFTQRIIKRKGIRTKAEGQKIIEALKGLRQTQQRQYAAAQGGSA